MLINVFTDGGARGNPGISAYGLVIKDQNKKTIYQQGKFLGINTNNEAEYMGLIAAITWLIENQTQLNPDSIVFHLDSQLIVRQVQGLYKVKAPNLKPLYQSAIKLLSQLKSPYTFVDVRRQFNSQADLLANQAMDQKI